MSERTGQHGDGWRAIAATSFLVAGILGITLLAFRPAREAQFVNWDDDKNFEANEEFRGLGRHQLRWMFTTFQGGHYQPLTWLSLALDYRFGGHDPKTGKPVPPCFHRTNLWLHALAAVAFFFLSRRLLALSSGLLLRPFVRGSAAVAALFFAIHPLRVESVAWVTERRDVLSGLLLFCAVLSYLAAAESRSRPSEDSASVGRAAPRRYAVWLVLSVGLYALSLLSKAAAMGLVGVLLVLDVYPLRRLGGRTGWLTPAARVVWFEKVPFALLGAVSAAVALVAQSRSNALIALEQHDVLSRLAQATYGLCFYLCKTVYPFDLGPIYDIPSRSALLGGAFAARIALLGSIAVAVVLLRRRWPAGWAVGLTYLLFLVPVLGFAQSGPQLVADRYSYLACTGVALLVGGGVLRTLRAWVRGDVSRGFACVIVGAAGAWIAMLGVLTHLQTRVWRDSLTLWQHAIVVSPGSAIAHANLGDALNRLNRPREAIAYFQSALRLDPLDVTAHHGLGVAFLQTGRSAEALEEVHRAVDLGPANPYARANLAHILAGFGRLTEAADHYEEALRLKPDFREAQARLIPLLRDLGRHHRAAELAADGTRRYARDLRFAADLAWIRATCPDLSIRNADEALLLAQHVCGSTDRPDPHALRTLAAALAEGGRFDEALATATHAEKLARDARQNELAASLHADQDQYRAGRPLRE